MPRISAIARTTMLALVIAAAVPASGRARQGTPGAATPAANTPVAVVAGGLVNPRGFAFDPNGALYVGLGGRPGPTAGVVAVADGCPRPVVDGLPTSRVAFGAISGVADVAFLDDRLYLLLSGGNIDGGVSANGLYRVEDDGTPSLVADISSFIRDNPVTDRPPDYDTDGQPYALLATDDGFLVTEGNSNQLLRVTLDGAVTRVADLSQGHPIPTGIAPAPDGGTYVAFLSRAPYAEGSAKVVLVARDGTLSDAWTGLSLVTALALGPDGALYALEMATGHGDDPDAIAPGTGRVVRRTGPDSAEAVVTGLALPVAMDFGPDGGLYVASPAFGADDGQGAILRVDLSGGAVVEVPDELPGVSACS